MFKTVLVIYYLTGHINVVRSEVWLQNEQRSNSSITASKNQSKESSVNITDTVTAILINVSTRGAPRSLNVTSSRPRKRNSTIVNRQAESRRVWKRSEEKLPLIYQSTSSNPKNDVEVFRPLEGGPPAYGPQGPQQPSFPPSLPDYPSGVYPYEPPYYYPVYSNDVPPYQPYYPPVFPVNPVYPTSPPRLPPATRLHPNYPEHTTVMHTHETEPTTPSTPEHHGRSPVKEPEPEIIVPGTKKPITRTKPTKLPNTSTFTASRGPKTSVPPYFRTKSHTTQWYGTKSTAKRQTFVYRPATQSYPYGQYTTASPVYNIWNYSPTTADPRTIFYPWTTKKPPLIVPQAFYPYITGTNVQGNAAVSGYPPSFEAASVQIGGRATNRTSEKLKSGGSWMPPARKVEILGAPSALDPKFKLAVVSNYENFNETAGTFGFNIDLENGITVQIRGYKKNGTQILDGSFSLFTNEGEPVRVAYTADDEKDKHFTQTTPVIESEVPEDDDESSTIEKDEVAVTTTESLDN